MVLCLFCAAVSLRGQDLDQAVLASHDIGSGIVYGLPDDTDWRQRLEEVKRWVADFTSWQRWDAAWHNQPEPGWLGARPRRQRPDPPGWLAVECADASLEEGLLAAACRALIDWRDDEVVAQLRRDMVSARAQKEAPTRSVWWEHIHVDGLWPVPQWGSGVLGVVGMHASVDVAGRLQVFVAPGAIVLNLPNGQNSREWKPATDWGIGYRLFDFTFPGTEQRSSLNLNLAKAWVLADPIGVFPGTVDLVGFSLTFKRSR
jgi:hypothetical protein